MKVVMGRKTNMRENDVLVGDDHRAYKDGREISGDSREGEGGGKIYHKGQKKANLFKTVTS